MDKSKPIMSVKEVAKYLDVHPISIYRYIKQKKIPVIKLGKLWKFRKERIDEWLKEKEKVSK